MIGYVTVGTKDPKKAAAFYDRIAAELGAVRVMDNDRIIAWGKPGGTAGLCLALPFDGKPMTSETASWPHSWRKTKPRLIASTSSRCRSAAPAKALPVRVVAADFTRAISVIPKATSSTHM